MFGWVYYDRHLTRSLWQQHDFPAAADKFQQAVNQNPNLVAAWNGLGWSRFNDDQRSEAGTAFLEALKRDTEHGPTSAAAFNGLGQISFAENKLEPAERWFLQAAPKAPAAWWGLTKIYLLQSKWDDAKKYAPKIVHSGDISGDMLNDAKAMLQAATDQKLLDDLREKISPPATQPNG